MLAKFQKSLEALCPGWRDERFVVAFSGGLDSTALLELMAALAPRANLAAAHLNHQLRGQASADDQSFAAGLARELGLAFITESRPVASLAVERRRGLEEAARFARYLFLADAAANFGARFILTAHQADDQAETMLINFIKGAGAGGLAGIRPRRPQGEAEVLRPLLPFARAELRGWLTARERRWVEDASNQDARHLRNALRRDVLPRLRELNPRLVQALGRAAVILRGEEEFWREHLAKLWPETVVEESARSITLNRARLESLSLAERKRLVYEALLKLWRLRRLPGEPLSHESVATVLELAARPGRQGLDLPGGLRAETGPDHIRLGPASRFLNKTGSSG
jgi:tRNA(Ile)-lysidine synthase